MSLLIKTITVQVSTQYGSNVTQRINCSSGYATDYNLYVLKDSFVQPRCHYGQPTLVPFHITKHDSPIQWRHVTPSRKWMHC